MDAIRRSKPGPGVKPPAAAADDVKGGIKVDEDDGNANASPISNGAKRITGVRKTWKPEAVKSSSGPVNKAKSPVQGIRRLRSDAAAKSSSSSSSKSPELRKVKSECGGIDAVSLRKTKSGCEVAENGGIEVASSVEEEEEERDDEVSSSNLDQEIKSDPKNDESDIKAVNDDEEDEELSEYDDGEEIVVEIEKKETAVAVAEQEAVILDAVSSGKLKSVAPNLSKQIQSIEKPKPIVVNKHTSASTPIKPAVFSRIQRTTSSSSSPINKPAPPIAKQSSTVNQRIPKCDAYAYERFPETQNKLQNLADLVMWRDASKSAFVFGIGAFTIISSSYTKDVNISFVSVMSYLGLVYLAAIFLYRSLICRGYVDIQHKGNVLGEEEAIWLLRLVLPYLNEFLLKIKAMFSGDPATTMKLAVLLFVLAKCGSSITIWNMAKLGFFGVFTVPKLCSAYSTQFTAYGKFWVRRFKDAWDSCSHKKAAAFGIFTLVWNFSSVVARVWTVFVLFVAVRYYQQSLVTEDWAEDEKEADDLTEPRADVAKRGRGPAIVESLKERKVS